MKTGRLHLFASFSLLAAGLGVFLFIARSNNAGQRDFISYWAAGQQLRSGGNPYDGAAILPMERAAGFDQTGYLIMRNPPLALFMAVPLGYVSANAGVILWLLALLASVVASIRLVWTLHGRPTNRLHLLGYYFAPLMWCMMAGQVGNFLLLGIVLFLCFRESQPYLSGAALLLCAVKPHLFVPFGIVLLAWIVNKKAYRILAGFCVATLASCALSFCLDSHAWSQYWQMVSTAGIIEGTGPNLSNLFRLLLHRNSVWLQFVPEATGCCWSLWFFWTRRTCWNWMNQGLLLLLISEVCAPYSWFTDEAMLLPAVMAGIYRAEDSRRSLLPFGLIAGVALLEVLTGVKMTSSAYLWTTPAWVLWYLYATGSKGRDAEKLRGSKMIADLQLPR